MFTDLIQGITLHCRHNERDDVSNHQPHACFLRRLFRCRSMKTPKLRVTGLCEGKSLESVNSPHKEGPVMRKMFTFDDVIMISKRDIFVAKNFDAVLNVNYFYISIINSFESKQGVVWMTNNRGPLIRLMRHMRQTDQYSKYWNLRLYLRATEVGDL